MSIVTLLLSWRNHAHSGPPSGIPRHSGNARYLSAGDELSDHSRLNPRATGLDAGVFVRGRRRQYWLRVGCRERAVEGEADRIRVFRYAPVSIAPVRFVHRVAHVKRRDDD